MATKKETHELKMKSRVPLKNMLAPLFSKIYVETVFELQEIDGIFLFSLGIFGCS